MIGPAQRAPPPPPAAAFPNDSTATAMNAVDGKKLGKGMKSNDGEVKNSYTMATDPVLYVLNGLAVVYESAMPQGKLTVKTTEILKKADDSRYTCVVYQAGMMAYYRFWFCLSPLCICVECRDVCLNCGL